MNGDLENRRILCDIARSAFEVVNRFLFRDQLLARELRSNETGSRQIFREECITTEMAATLREQFPQHVEITLFTMPEEKRTGADWYWRFEKGNQAIHARVQAKRVQRTEFGQEDSDGHIDIDLDQLQTLLESTNNAQHQLPQLQAWLASYVRFDATPPCGQSDLQQCVRHHHLEPCMNHGPSLWIAQTQEILDLNENRLSAQDLIGSSVRLDCILPCINEHESQNGPGYKGFNLSNISETYKDCVAIIENDQILRKQFEGAMRIVV